MNKLFLPNYNLHWTLLGGQSFSWDFDETRNLYTGFTQNRIIKLKRHGEYLFWQTFPQKDDIDFMQKYLRLNIDYQTILLKIQKDEIISDAIQKYPHLRLLQQDFELTLYSFILSSTKNIPAIRKCVRDLSYSLGDKITVENKEYYLFPKSEVIAQTAESILRESKIGFRAKYLKEAAIKLTTTDFLTQISQNNEVQTRESLTSLTGVGDKIADCVMNFSLCYDSFTPLDVWGKRVFIDLYKLDSKMKYDEMRNWIKVYFEGYGAWAGQFLFESIRVRTNK